MTRSSKKLLIVLAVFLVLGGSGLVLVFVLAGVVGGVLFAARQQTEQDYAMEMMEKEQQAILEEMEQSELQFESDAQRLTDQYEQLAGEMVAGAAAGDAAQIEALSDQSRAMSEQLEDSAERLTDQQLQAMEEMLEAQERAAK